MFSASKSASVSSAYALTKSLRFRSSATAYLNRTPSTATNRRTWTWSAWVKRGKLGVIQELFDAYWANTDNGYFWIGFTNADALEIQLYNSTLRTTSAIYRDSSAWYHIVVAIDTTLATASNRVRLYVNGSEVTAFSTNTAPTQNLDTAINYNGAHYIGSFQGTSNLFDGYQTDVYLIDGQQLTPSSFGATDATTGQWSPAKYTGTYGTNGFHLTFANATSTTTLGYDTSGNSNNWTTNNISLTAGSTYDSMNDVPVAYSATASNYAVLNPSYGSTTITNGNLTVVMTTVPTSYGSISFTTGKWYWEITVASAVVQGYLGVMDSTYILPGGTWTTQARAYVNDGSKYNGATTSYGSTWTNGDVIGVAVDMSAGTIVFYKNNTSQGTAFSDLAGKEWKPMFFATSATYNVNFGQQPFTYSAPSGYNAVNTYNLSTPTIAQGNKYMDATLYTGTGATLAITNAGSFQPDWIWVKERSAVRTHCLTDSVRGFTKYLFSDSTGAEETYSTLVTSVNSNGFSLGTSVAVNDSGQTYVGWQWKASNATAVSNTSGSITSSVSANTTAGFSVVTFTGNGSSSATVGHGLGVTPSMIIQKNRSGSANNWFVYHKNLTAGNYITLTTGAEGSIAGTGGGALSTSPTSTTYGFTAGSSSADNVNTSGNTYVAYCFAPIAGYSAFGSYVGNNSSPSPFVYLGFRPRFIMFKNITLGGDWNLLDTSRSPYNQMNSALQPNANYAEASNANYTMNYYSNGFQVLTSNDELDNYTIIYMAFAENPFKYANAR